ncbi:unnamed protein product, partial [Effrenium voratum]
MVVVFRCLLSHMIYAFDLQLGRFYKQTRLCSFHQAGACKRGSACNFAHSDTDLKEMPDFSKTRICKSFAIGCCELGDACSFAHGQHELVQAKKLNRKAKEEAKKMMAPPQVARKGTPCSYSDEEEATLSTRCHSEGSRSSEGLFEAHPSTGHDFGT